MIFMAFSVISAEVVDTVDEQHFGMAAPELFSWALTISGFTSVLLIKVNLKSKKVLDFLAQYLRDHRKCTISKTIIQPKHNLRLLNSSCIQRSASNKANQSTVLYICSFNREPMMVNIPSYKSYQSTLVMIGVLLPSV